MKKLSAPIFIFTLSFAFLIFTDMLSSGTSWCGWEGCVRRQGFPINYHFDTGAGFSAPQFVAAIVIINYFLIAGFLYALHLLGKKIPLKRIWKLRFSCAISFLINILMTGLLGILLPLTVYRSSHNDSFIDLFFNIGLSYEEAPIFLPLIFIPYGVILAITTLWYYNQNKNKQEL